MPICLYVHIESEVTDYSGEDFKLVIRIKMKLQLSILTGWILRCNVANCACSFQLGSFVYVNSINIENAYFVGTDELRSNIHGVYGSPEFLTSSSYHSWLPFSMRLLPTEFLNRDTIIDVSNSSVWFIHGQCHKVMEDLDGFHFCPTC
jgi:hypothetical protein